MELVFDHQGLDVSNWCVFSEVQYHAFIGMPGVGKTHTMLHDHLQRVVDMPGLEFIITSQTTYAVDTAVSRLPKHLTEKINCRTLHSLLYQWGAKEHAETGLRKAHKTEEHKRRAFRRGQDDFELDAYVKQAPSNLPGEVLRRRDYLANFEPYSTSDYPDWLDEPSIHRSLVYDMTLLRFWRELKLDPREQYLPGHVRGFLFLDEAQDVTKLQAAVLLKKAKQFGWLVRVYGDPNQQISYGYDAPLFSDLKPDESTVLQGHPDHKRVPWKIAKLAWSLVPSAPHWREWANLQEPGEIRIFDKPIYPAPGGYSISESRARVRTCAKSSLRNRYSLVPQLAHHPDWDLHSQPVFSTVHGTKGWEAETVIAQRWLPKNQKRVRSGESVALRQLFTLLTRCKKTLYIHREMYNLCVSE